MEKNLREAGEGEKRRKGNEKMMFPDEGATKDQQFPASAIYAIAATTAISAITTFFHVTTTDAGHHAKTTTNSTAGKFF